MLAPDDDGDGEADQDQDARRMPVMPGPPLVLRVGRQMVQQQPAGEEGRGAVEQRLGDHGGAQGLDQAGRARG